MERPDTVMGRRLAERALRLVGAAEGDELRAGSDAGVDINIDLTEPESEQTPEHVRAAAHDALDRGETHYTSGAGIFLLRRALAERSTAEGFPATPDGIVVTNGGAEALYIALQSVLRPGDRVLVAGPGAPGVGQLIAFIGAVSVPLPVQRAARFIPDPTAILDAEPAPRVVLLASPSPVTGVAIPAEQLAALIDAAHARGVLVILDRSLAWCGFEQHDGIAVAGASVLTIGSFSTAYAMSGWRVGYVAAPDDLINLFSGMSDLKVAMSICTSAISQYAALAALDGPTHWLDVRRASFIARRDLALGLLREAGMDAVVPDADAWPSLLLDTRLMHPDDCRAARMLANDTGVRVEPASRYGPSLAGYTRITLAAPEVSLRDGLQRIGAFHNACG